MATQSGSPRRIAGDSIVVICFAILTTLYLYNSFFFERTLMSDYVGPATFPQMLAAFGLILTAIYFFQLRYSKARPSRKDDESEEIGAVERAGIASLLPVVPIVFYVVILEPIGFLFSTAIYVFVAMLVYGQTIVKSLIYAAVMSLTSFIIFYYLLLTQVPMGWLVRTDRLMPFIVHIRRAIEG